jgi:hypothetical protein
VSAVVLISLYFLALTAFLGLDVLGKVPVSLVALVTAALGAVGGIVVVAAYVVADRASAPLSQGLGVAALGVGAAAAGAALASMARLFGPWTATGKSRPS